MITIQRAELDRLVGEATRPVFVRYFNLYRIVLASAFAIFAGVFKVSGQSVETFRVLVALYWFFAVIFATVPVSSSGPSNTVLVVQVTIDIWVLVALMYLSGGMLSGIPYLLMTTIAGAGLLGEGRLVLGFAAMATIAVLSERFLRISLGEADINDISVAGMTSVGYFAVGWIAQMLSRRARANEELALVRGADLERQRTVNARIIEDMLDGVVVLDRNGIVRQFNPCTTELLGLSLQVAEKLSVQSPTLANLIQINSMESASYSPAFRAAESGRHLRVRRVPAGDNGDLVLYLEDLDRMQVQAQQITLAALGRLTANIAHEIRNPLSAIVHAGDLLREEKRGDMQLRLLQIVRDNAARIERIIKDVLELGRRDRATVERLNLKVFLRGFMEEFSIHTPAALTVLNVQVEKEPQIYFDRVHLHQILNNLISNAMRYCKNTPGSVQIIAQQINAERVLILVGDDGQGIPIEDHSKVFEPFFTSHPKGTGLGLYVARELADANGASLILAENSSLGGAEFHLYCKGIA